MLRVAACGLLGLGAALLIAALLLSTYTASKIQKIPLKPEDWSRLEELASELSRRGVSATAGQVASVMVHSQLKRLAPSIKGHARSSRRG